MSKAHAPELKKFVDKKLLLKLNAGQNVQGVLRGYDPFLNIVLDNTVEVKKNGDEVPIGMVVIRGNSIVMMEAQEHIGSHIGSYLLPICSLFNPNIRCIGLEIDGLLFNISQDNMEINHISHKVQLINKAIIENSHINYSFCSPSINNSGNGQIYNNFNENNERYCGMLKTNQLINSSSLLMEMKRKDNEFVFLKIDVEGSEWRFFCNETFLPNQCKLNEQWFPKTQNKFVVVVVMEIGVMQFENNKLLRSLLKGLNNYFGGSAWETNRINRVDVSIDNLPWNLLFIDYRLLLQLSDDVLLNF